VAASSSPYRRSASGFVLVVATSFLALGGVAGFVGINLPWFIFSSDLYHSEPSLLDGLFLVFTKGAWLMSANALIIVVDALALIGAYKLVRGAATKVLLATTFGLALIGLVGTFGVDTLSYFFQLEPPFIVPRPGAGQILSLVGLASTAAGALLGLLRRRTKR
jgi:hypothetical protein